MTQAIRNDNEDRFSEKICRAVLFISTLLREKEKEKRHGGRKLKLNFKLFTGKTIGIITERKRIKIDTLEQVVRDRKEGLYLFTFEKGYSLTIQEDILKFHCKIIIENDCIFFEYSQDPILFGLIAYLLFETYGLPLEFSVDEMARIEVPVDEEGFHQLEELQHNRNKDTYKDKDAFG